MSEKPTNVVLFADRQRSVAAVPTVDAGGAPRKTARIVDFVAAQNDQQLRPKFAAAMSQAYIRRRGGNVFASFSLSCGVLGQTTECILASAERFFCNKLRFSNLVVRHTTNEDAIVFGVPKAEYDRKIAYILSEFAKPAPAR